MKAFISADWEGISGLVSGRNDQSNANSWMTQDVNAAVAGAFDGGATGVVVKDAHAGALNIDAQQLDERATLISGWSPLMCMVDGLDESFQALILIGAHARNHTTAGVLHHTFTGRFDEVRLNGQPFGEAGLSTVVAGHYGVPTVMVSGDEATCTEVCELLGDVQTAPVKKGLAREAAVLVPLKEAREMIRNAAKQALSNLSGFRPLRLDPPIQLEIDLTGVPMADLAALVPGIERVGPRTVRASASDPLEMWRFFRVITIMAGSA